MSNPSSINKPSTSGGEQNSSQEFDEMNIDLLSYLEKFNPILLNQLYECPTACLAVFRELPSLAQNFVLRLMFIEQPIPQAVVSSWVKSIR